MSAIELYLIRHGIATDHGTYAQDSERPLTDEGQERTRQVAQRLYELGIQFDLIQTSPLIRARQTADILQLAGLGRSLKESSYLAPEGSFEDWVSWLQSWEGKRLAIVGHEPNLGEWTERLVWGSVHHHLVVKKAAVIGLLLPKSGSAVGNSQLFWLTPPKLLL